MSVVFTANLGVRDLCLDGRHLGSPRADGERLLKEWPSVADHLSLPIIQPILRHLQEQEAFPSYVVLFATDQPPSAGAGNRDRDTVHCAELAKRLLERKYSLARRVFVRATREENPALYDEMYQFFRDETRRIVEKSKEPISRCYVSVAGGTPAANTGLLLAAIERFGEKCGVLYLKEGTSTPRELEVGRLIHASTLRRVCAAHLESYQFAAALPLVDELKPHRACCWSEMLQYCHRRLNFDFAGALKALAPAWPTAVPEDRRLLERAEEEARRLAAGGDRAALLAELANALRVTRETGAYLDYLTRLVSLEEAAARLIVERHLPPLSYLDDDYQARKRRQSQIAEAADLQAYAREKPVNGEPLQIERSNTAVLLALVDYLAAERPSRPARWTTAPERRHQLAEAARLLRWLEDLNQMRNKAVHRFGGTSWEQIEQAYRRAAGEDRDLPADVQRLVLLATERPAEGWLIDHLKNRLIAYLLT